MSVYSLAFGQDSHSASSQTQTVDARSLLYLSPGQARGGEWCLDPGSPRTRQILTAPTDSFSSSVNASDLAQDLVDLQQLLRTQYPGYAVAAQAPGFDVNRFFDNWREQLRGRQSISFADGVIAPLRELRDKIIDQHLTAWGTATELKKNSLMDVHEFQTTIGKPSLDLKTCTVRGTQRVYESTLRISRLLSSRGLERLVTVSAAADGPLTLQCGGEQWKLTERQPHPMPKPREAEPFYQWSAFGDTAVIRIRRLWGTTKDLVNLAQIAKDFPQHSKFGRVIFDLRANSGGDDSYVYAWISEAKNGTWSSGAETRRVGDLFPCDDWNMTVIRQVLDHTVDSETARTEREKLRSGWPDRAPEDREIFNDGLITYTSQHPYGGRLYALIDRQSLSSGESSAFVLRQAFGAILLGERSGGMLTFGNVRTVILPRTGIRFNVPTKRNWFNQPIEVVGVPVDVYVENSGISVEDLLPMLDLLETQSGQPPR
jgi:hypothetical protein